MIRNNLEGVEWLEFELLAPFKSLKHAVFLRHGGYSRGAHDSLNLSFTMGDDSTLVEKNLAKAQSILSIDSLASAHQVHQDGIKKVTRENFEVLEERDALITHISHLGLKVTHADCQAAIFYDPIHHAVATVHCGWRGHVCEIYGKVIAAMSQAYQSKPADLHVAIAPSLGPQHAEFVNYRAEFPEPFWHFQTKENHFDLWALASWQLTGAGILPPHIQFAQMCTFANPVDCFSYRRGERVTGAHGTFAMLLEP